MTAVAAGVIALIAAAPAAASGPQGTPITSCTTGAIQGALAAGGSWVLQCSGDIGVPGGPFLVSRSVTIAAGHGAKVKFDGLNQFRVFDVGAGGNLTLSGVTITHGKVSGANGGNAPAGDAGGGGGDGSGGVNGPSGTPGGPGDDGTNGGSGGFGGAGALAQGGGMLISLGGSATLTKVNFTSDSAIGGKGGSGGKGGKGGNGGSGGSGGSATSQSGSGGNGGNGGSGGSGGQGGNGGGGGSAFGGAIYNAGTLTISGGNYSHDKAKAGSGGKGGGAGNGGKAGRAGGGGDDQGLAVDGSGGAGGAGGDGGGDGAGGSGGIAQGGAIYNTGTLSIDGAKFTGDSAEGGKGANAGKLGKGGAGGNGGEGADGRHSGGDPDGDAGGLGGAGGDGGQGGTLGANDVPGAGGNGTGGAIFTKTNFSPTNVTLSGNKVKGAPAGKATPAAAGGRGGKGGGGNGGAAANGADGAPSGVSPGAASNGTGTDPNISPASIIVTVTQPGKCVVPALSGQAEAAAKAALATAGCKTGKVTKVKSQTVPKGQVISTSPGAGAVRKSGTKVSLKVSNGAKKPPTPKCKVPSLKGKTLSAATAALTSANCTLGTVKKKHSSTIPKGSVIKSSPKGGSKRKAGTAVNLTVSSGKKKKKK